MAVLEISHINSRFECRSVRVRNLATLIAARFETWLRLPAVPVGFGRGSEQGLPWIQLDDAETRWHHYHIAPHGDGWVVTDTFVNPVHPVGAHPPQPLADGDELRIGGMTARFHLAEPELETADATERGLLDAIRQGAAGSEEVYLDWLEEHALHDRAELLRLLRIEPSEHVQYVLRYRDLARAIDPGWRVRLLLARDRA